MVRGIGKEQQDFFGRLFFYPSIRSSMEVHPPGVRAYLKADLQRTVHPKPYIRHFSEQDGDFPCHILRLGKNDLGMLIGHRMSTGWDSFGSAAESRMGVSYC